MEVLSRPEFLHQRFVLKIIVESLIVIKREVLIHPVKRCRTQRRSMRLIIGNRQEEILVSILLKETDCTVGTPMCIGETLAHLRAVRRRTLSRFYTLLLRQFLKIASHIIPVVRVPALRALSISKIVSAVEMPLSDITAVYILICQTLTDRLHTLTERHTVRRHSIAVREKSGENRTSRRTTDRLTGIRILIANSALCQMVEIWSLHPTVPVTAKHILSCRVRHKENDLSLSAHLVSSLILSGYIIYKF